MRRFFHHSRPEAGALNKPGWGQQKLLQPERSTQYTTRSVRAQLHSRADLPMFLQDSNERVLWHAKCIWISTGRRPHAVYGDFPVFGDLREICTGTGSEDEFGRGRPLQP